MPRGDTRLGQCSRSGEGQKTEMVDRIEHLLGGLSWCPSVSTGLFVKTGPRPAFMEGRGMFGKATREGINKRQLQRLLSETYGCLIANCWNGNGNGNAAMGKRGILAAKGRFKGSKGSEGAQTARRHRPPIAGPSSHSCGIQKFANTLRPPSNRLPPPPTPSDE